MRRIVGLGGRGRLRRNFGLSRKVVRFQAGKMMTMTMMTMMRSPRVRMKTSMKMRSRSDFGVCEARGLILRFQILYLNTVKNCISISRFPLKILTFPSSAS